MPFRLRRDESRLGDLLTDQALLVVVGAGQLASALDGDRSARQESAGRLQETDHASEAAAHAVLRALTAAFVTPFDRADVYRLCWAMRVCVVRMDAAADALALFELGQLPDGAADLVQLVVLAAEVTADAIPRLGRPRTLTEPWIELTRLVKQSGQVHRRLLVEVTSTTDTDAARMVQHVAVTYALSRVAEAFEAVADAVQTVAVKGELSVELALVVLAVATALAFAWTNGFHDAANAVATSLSTGALTPWTALPLAAVLNAVGALLGVGLADLVGTGLVDVPVQRPALAVAISALLTAVGWNVLTWYFGLPSSSSQALIAALAGAGTAAGARVDWHLIQTKVALPMVVSPIVGFLGAWVLMLVLLRLFRDAAHGPAIRGFRMAQGVSAAAVSVGHGLQDGQKAMGVIVLVLVAGGYRTAGDGVPMWARVAVALALGLGTAAGGWRIIRTLSRRIVAVDPVTGFAAESVTAAVLFVATGLAGVPVSSSQTVTAAIMGAGSTAGVRAIRWGTVRWIALAWVGTPLVTFACAAATFAVGSAVVP